MQTHAPDDAPRAAPVLAAHCGRFALGDTMSSHIFGAHFFSTRADEEHARHIRIEMLDWNLLGNSFTIRPFEIRECKTRL